MAKLKIMDFQNIAYDTEWNLDEIESVEVTVITGDEIMFVHTKDGREHYIDAQDYSGNPRLQDYFDGEYTVISGEALEEWNNRKTTYDHIDLTSEEAIGGLLEWLESLF